MSRYITEADILEQIGGRWDILSQTREFFFLRHISTDTVAAVSRRFIIEREEAGLQVRSADAITHLFKPLEKAETLLK